MSCAPAGWINWLTRRARRIRSQKCNLWILSCEDLDTKATNTHSAFCLYKSGDPRERSNELECPRFGTRGIRIAMFCLFKLGKHKPHLLFIFSLKSEVSIAQRHHLTCAPLSQSLLHSAIINFVLHIQMGKRGSWND